MTREEFIELVEEVESESYNRATSHEWGTGWVADGLAGAKEKLNMEFDRMTARIAELENEIEEYQSEIDGMESTIDLLESEIDPLALAKQEKEDNQ